MSAPHGQTIIAGYLRRLDGELRGLPRRRREEIVADISEHIADARSERGDVAESDAELLSLLDRLGEPAAIAAEARERFGVEGTGHAGLREVVALVLLGPGNLIIPLVSWFAGAVLTWQSPAWTPAQKRRSLYFPLFAILIFFAAINLGPPPLVGQRFFDVFVVAGPIGVPVVCTAYLAWHIGRRLPRIAWVAGAVVTTIITIPCIAVSLPVHSHASLGGPRGGCGTFHGMMDLGGGLGASTAINVPYCTTGTRSYTTGQVACHVTSHGTLAVDVDTCRAQVWPDDGEMWITLHTISRAVTSVAVTRNVNCTWIVRNGQLLDGGC